MSENGRQLDLSLFRLPTEQSDTCAEGPISNRDHDRMRVKDGFWTALSRRIDLTGKGSGVRSRRPGDRYRTELRSQEKKLKELFQRRRIPRSQRDRLVVIEGDGQILWVEGFPSPQHLDPSSSVTPQMQLVEIEVRSETSSA